VKFKEGTQRASLIEPIPGGHFHGIERMPACGSLLQAITVCRSGFDFAGRRYQSELVLSHDRINSVAGSLGCKCGFQDLLYRMSAWKVRGGEEQDEREFPGGLSCGVWIKKKVADKM
jgi:hypothetical protein